MLIIRWLILSLSLLYLSAYSYAQPQTQSAQAKTTSKEEKFGSEKLPLSIKIVPAVDAGKKAAREEQYREEKASEDWWLTKSTIWLAIVTTILAIQLGVPPALPGWQ